MDCPHAEQLARTTIKLSWEEIMFIFIDVREFGSKFGEGTEMGTFFDMPVPVAWRPADSSTFAFRFHGMHFSSCHGMPRRIAIGKTTRRKENRKHFNIGEE